MSGGLHPEVQFVRQNLSEAGLPTFRLMTCSPHGYQSFKGVQTETEREGDRTSACKASSGRVLDAILWKSVLPPTQHCPQCPQKLA